MSSSYIPTKSNVLPIPKVRLSTIDFHKDIQIYDDNLNTVLRLARLRRYPEVIAMDLTDEQIDKGVYLEMIVYKHGFSKTSLVNNQSEYKIPASWIGGVNLFNGKPTRGGTQRHLLTGLPVAVDRPNHYKVASHNQVINAWEYLNNRFIERGVAWRDTSGTVTTIPLLIPSWRKNKQRPFGQTFMYSSVYSPLYVAFRYIMENEDGLRFHSGPLSRVVKICHERHPFNVDAAASALLGSTCGTINPLLDINNLHCYFETRLP